MVLLNWDLSFSENTVDPDQMDSYKAIRLFSILIHANNGMLQVKRIKIGEECST